MDNFITLLEQYKYVVLLPLAIIEGPILTVVAGFLVTLGLLNSFLVYVIIVAGDVIGDSIAYAFGRWGSSLLHSHGSYIGITTEKIVRAKEYFAARHNKAIVMSKLVYGIGTVGLVTAGSLKIPYLRYLRSCFAVSLLQALVFLVIGLSFGHAYVQIGKYLDNFAAIASVVALTVGLVFVLYKLKPKRT
ncbi:MAG: hypothetical protein UY07_C0022G0025 [Parcubacteria group bacterium GW2011_GWA1_47_8]|nr:MAG: hypothetical protein UY07_C0022G0025 [Parcubacteria group bacterium GW2011_GWA1_47_8]KKW07882.1 MAG: hypothetical protein UY42_C0004G0024 [Parcubacteria group bacterium GW2011_GWA2_49_16]